MVCSSSFGINVNFGRNNFVILENIRKTCKRPLRVCFDFESLEKMVEVLQNPRNIKFKLKPFKFNDFIEAFFEIVLQLDEISKVRSFDIDKFSNNLIIMKYNVSDGFFILVNYSSNFTFNMLIGNF